MTAYDSLMRNLDAVRVRAEDILESSDDAEEQLMLHMLIANVNAMSACYTGLQRRIEKVVEDKPPG